MATAPPVTPGNLHAQVAHTLFVAGILLLCASPGVVLFGNSNGEIWADICQVGPLFLLGNPLVPLPIHHFETLRPLPSQVLYAAHKTVRPLRTDFVMWVLCHLWPEGEFDFRAHEASMRVLVADGTLVVASAQGGMRMHNVITQEFWGALGATNDMAIGPLFLQALKYLFRDEDRVQQVMPRATARLHPAAPPTRDAGGRQYLNHQLALTPSPRPLHAT